MDNPRKDESVNPNALPEKDIFDRKEGYQYKQPADTGKALETEESKNEETHASADLKDAEKAGSSEGLNEENSNGTAGAFEGFEDHSNE